MAKYIDKDKIATEIEKRYEYWREKEFNSHSIESEARMSECQHLMLLFNTIETKEVDLEKEAELIANGIMIPVQANLYHTNIYNFEKRCFKHSDLKEAARKGIELGLKSKEE